MRDKYVAFSYDFDRHKKCLMIYSLKFPTNLPVLRNRFHRPSPQRGSGRPIYVVTEGIRSRFEFGAKRDREHERGESERQQPEVEIRCTDGLAQQCLKLK